MTSRSMMVVAGALQREDGLWLMHRRPLEKHHGGLWEFPGGKVEPTEIPVQSICRELREELGIAIESSACTPVTFAEERGADGDRGSAKAIVILLYKVERWEGVVRSLEGGAVDWFTPEAIANLPKPPLDEVLAGQLFA